MDKGGKRQERGYPGPHGVIWNKCIKFKINFENLSKQGITGSYLC